MLEPLEIMARHIKAPLFQLNLYAKFDMTWFEDLTECWKKSFSVPLLDNLLSYRLSSSYAK